jgi:hypothetical protein
MARPFVDVHSGITTMAESGLSFRSWLRVTKRADGEGVDRGGESARMMAWKREMRSTRREFGYEAVKMGSKMAARYRLSMGEVNEDAINVPGCGRRFWCLASDLIRLSVLMVR